MRVFLLSALRDEHDLLLELAHKKVLANTLAEFYNCRFPF